MRSRRKKGRRLASAQELLPLEEIAGDLLRLRGGDYRAVLQAGSVNFALKSETEQEAILAGYRRFLNGLAYPLQVLVRVVPTDVEAYLAGLRDARSGTDTLRRLAQDHEAFVRRMARERTLLDRRFYVVVPAGMDGAFERNGLSWPWRRGAVHERQRSDLIAARRKLAFRCGEVMQGLGSFGVTARRLDGDELAALWRATLGTVTAVSSLRGALVVTPVVIRSERAGAVSGA
ncbi:MAG: hypothetical protein R3C39_15150 [Dehalococcoidia bacterium]